MITVEYVELDGKQFRRTASDTYTIRKIGTDEVYREAMDIPESTYDYEETDIPLEPIEEPSDGSTVYVHLDGTSFRAEA